MCFDKSLATESLPSKCASAALRGSQIARRYCTSRARRRLKFAVADGACFFKPIKLVDFICSAETDNAPQLFARLAGGVNIYSPNGPDDNLHFVFRGH
jgi:hypothetical protein